MKKISLVTSQGKKQMCCGELIVLSEPQYEKLTDDHFSKQIDSIAKDLHVDWAIDVTSDANVLNITRTTANVIDDAFYHDLEIAAANFMSAIDKLEYNKKEPECPSHDNADEINAEKLAFVDSLIKDEESIRKNFRGIDVMAPYKGMPFAESICSMTLDTWFEILKTYSIFHHGDNKDA